MRCPLCPLCLCGSIRDGDSHRRDSPQRRREHREDLNPQHFICGSLDALILCVLCVSVVQFGTVTVIDGIHHRDAENTEKTSIHSISSVALWMRYPLCPLCLCGSIRDGDSHRRDSPQSRRVHGEDLNPQNFICGSLDALSSVSSVSLWFNSGR